MTSEEFIKACIDSGYAGKKTATEYCKDKEELTEDDFIEVYRIAEKRKHKARSDKWRFYQGTITTKRLKFHDDY